jgi:TetR/AcrR family transcriptional repressor of nem operon
MVRSVKKIDGERARIIEKGIPVIARGGFNATGLDAILKKASIPKGSFYYYFRSKEDFGLAVIDYCAAITDEQLTLALGNETGSPLKQLRAYFDSIIARQAKAQCRSGCLIGNLGQELAGQNEKYRQRLEEAFTRWEAHFVRCLAQAREKGEFKSAIPVNQLANSLLTSWEGAMLRAKVERSTGPLENFIQFFFEQVLR